MNLKVITLWMVELERIIMKELEGKIKFIKPSLKNYFINKFNFYCTNIERNLESKLQMLPPYSNTL